LGIKRLGRGVDHPTQCSAEVKERVKLDLFLLWAFVAFSRVNVAFAFTIMHIATS
jgi:hypothetical protein